MAKIKHIDLGSHVYETIKSMILSGDLEPGQKIVQEKLAQEIGVSRTPLLKALQILEHELLVESVPRRGMYVTKMELSDVIDAFECREGLEGIAARLTAERINDHQVQELRDLFIPFTEMGGDIPLKKYHQVDLKFHKSLIRFSGNKILTRIEMLGNIHIISYNRGLVRPPEETLNEHFGIIDAIANRNGELAEQRIKDHLRKSLDRMTAALQSGKLPKAMNE